MTGEKGCRWSRLGEREEQEFHLERVFEVSSRYPSGEVQWAAEYDF